MKTKKTVIILLALLTAGLSALMTDPKPVSAASGVINVPGDFSTIQAAINNANAGDTILVAAGTYSENVIINQTVTLMGNGYNVTFLEAQDTTKSVIDVKISNVNITKFTIQGGSTGVRVIGHNAINMSNNRIISNKNEGINLESSLNSAVVSNIISLNSFEGVYLQFSNKTEIHGNIISGNRDGIGLVSSSNNTISNNTIAYHTKLGASGIYLDFYSDYYTTFGNVINGNTIRNNTVGVRVALSNSSQLYHNNFINNTYQVDTFDSANSWNTTTEGNYWSDFAQRYPNASEIDATGIWDTPYLLDADTLQQDYLPLVNPWSPPTDVTPPITADDYDGLWHIANFTIQLTATDDLSGMKETYYKINDGPVSNITANGHPYLTTEDSNNTLAYWSVDNNNLEETHHLLTNIKLDKTAPSGSIQINNGAAYATQLSVALNVSATDSTSGMAQMRFSTNGTSWTTLEEYGITKAWDLTSGDGLKTVYVQYTDVAGWVSQAISDTIILDTASPAVSIELPLEGSEVKSSSVVVEWNGTDAGSGIDRYEIRLDAGSAISVGDEKTHTFTGLGDGRHTVYVKAFDKIGQSTEASVSFIVNTTPLGGVGYFEEILLIIVLVAAIVVIIYFIRARKKRRP